MGKYIGSAFAALVIALLVFTVSCQPKQDKNAARANQNQTTDWNTIETQVLNDRISKLEERVLSLETAQEMYRSVSLRVSNPGGFQRLDTDDGTFLIALKDVQPYLNGFRVALAIGNPTSADYKGFELNAKWGKRVGTDSRTYTEWRKSLRENKFSFLESLRAGTWTRITLHLAPASADELGTLELSMTTNVVSLRAH
jgi:hypothetical protein